MSAFTTLRLRDAFGRNGGEWFAETIEPRHIRELVLFRRLEPQAGWRLETRGYATQWHIYEPNLDEKCTCGGERTHGAR